MQLFTSLILLVTAVLPALVLGAPAGVVATPSAFTPETSHTAFSTYLGGGQQDQVRDVTTDAQGNIYMAGGTASAGFPTTPGAFDRSWNGWMDVFVTKFDPSGQIIWSTFLGGPEYDRAYGIEVDNQGNVYLTGRAGPGFPTTAGAFQTDYAGFYSGPAYGAQNAFVCKLRADGAALIFCSYIGPFEFMRDLDIDANGEIYTAGPHQPQEIGQPPAAWFVRAYQKTPQPRVDLVVLKIQSDGSRVLWATYFGGSGDDGLGPTLRTGRQGQSYVLAGTTSTDLPLTAPLQNHYGGGINDFMLIKFAADGSAVDFATYLGGSGLEDTETHGMALDAQDNVYVTGSTHSPDFPTTTGAFQRTYGGNGDIPVVKIKSDGSQLLAATYLGGDATDDAEGVDVDANGNLTVFGSSSSTNFPLTPDALQPKNAGGQDFIIAQLSPDLTRLLYGTYLGGAGTDQGRTGWTDPAANMITAGMSQSGDWPLNHPVVRTPGGDWDGTIAKIVRSPQATMYEVYLPRIHPK